MTDREMRAGETVFREGEESTSVAYLLGGRVEVVKDVEGTNVVLGEVGPGEFVGEMGVLEGRPRLATVRALTDVRLKVYEASEFLERLSSDGRMALGALHRLSERLRAANERLAECQGQRSGRAEAPPPPDGGAPHPASAEERRGPRIAPPPKGAARPLPSLTVLPDSDRTREVLPAEGQRLTALPYRVGRLPRSKESGAGLPVHLQLPDRSPYRLSRLHFAVVEDGDGYAIRDEGSHLGTTVNGVLIGQHAGKALARLRPGENVVVAGGRDSPFSFRILLAAP